MPVTTETRISLEGALCGKIWWPVGQLFGKHLSHSFAADVRAWGGQGTLRDHVLRATNDGDFQGAELTADTFLVIQRISRKGATVKTRTRHFPVSMFPSIADCVNTDAYSNDFMGDYE